MPTEFHLFPTLIPELRLLIWTYALPSPIHSCLYPYTYTTFTKATPTSPLTFSSSTLKPLLLDIPLLSVNAEARDIARSYCRRHNITIPSRDDGDVEARRYFNPDVDVIYGPRAYDLKDYCIRREIQEEGGGGGVGVEVPSRFAMLREEYEGIKGSWGLWFRNVWGVGIRVLYVVDGTEGVKLDKERTHWEVGEGVRAWVRWRPEGRVWEVGGWDQGGIEVLRPSSVVEDDSEQGHELEVRLVDVVRTLPPHQRAPRACKGLSRNEKRLWALHKALMQRCPRGKSCGTDDR